MGFVGTRVGVPEFSGHAGHASYAAGVGLGGCWSRICDEGEDGKDREEVVEVIKAGHFCRLKKSISMVFWLSKVCMARLDKTYWRVCRKLKCRKLRKKKIPNEI